MRFPYLAITIEYPVSHYIFPSRGRYGCEYNEKSQQHLHPLFLLYTFVKLFEASCKHEFDDIFIHCHILKDEHNREVVKYSAHLIPP